MFRNIAELLEQSETLNMPVSEIMITQEMSETGLSRQEIWTKMEQNLEVMAQAIARADKGVKSPTGLTGGDAVKMRNYIAQGRSICGETFLSGVAGAIGTNEVNAAMGIICATPTAGSAGVVPGCLFAVAEKFNCTHEQMIRFLFTAGAFGFVVANNASVSGAMGGCQAEVGSAAAMASAAIVEMLGGSAKQSAHAFSITLKNMLGLVCDPVAGLVEVPCVKRNASGASNAMLSADMALAGIESKIPADEIVDAMHKIGQSMPSALKETAQGGLAATKTGKHYESIIFKKENV